MSSTLATSSRGSGTTPRGCDERAWARADLSNASTRDVDPLREILRADLAEILPAPLAARLEAATIPGTAAEWLVAGAVYRAVASDPMLAARFLVELDSAGPVPAGLALARAHAWRMEPPPRDRGWILRDWLGLVLQWACAAVVLAARWWIFAALGICLGDVGRTSNASALEVFLGGHLWEPTERGELLRCLALAVAIVWLGLEAAVVPRLLEFFRRLPARLVGLPPPLSWRVDAFLATWSLSALVAQLVHFAHLSRGVWLLSWHSPDPSAPWWALGGLCLLGALVVGGLATALRAASPSPPLQ